MFNSKAEYSELMSRWVDADAEYEKKKAPIRNVEVKMSHEMWRGHFKRTDASQPEFRPQQLVTVARRFQAVVTAVDGSDVTVTFQENKKFDDWVKRLGTKVSCDITTEGRAMDAEIELESGTSLQADARYVYFKVSDNALEDIKVPALTLWRKMWMGRQGTRSKGNGALSSDAPTLHSLNFVSSSVWQLDPLNDFRQLLLLLMTTM